MSDTPGWGNILGIEYGLYWLNWAPVSPRASILFVYCRQLYSLADCVCVKIVNGPSCVRCPGGSVRQCRGAVQGNQRQRHQLQQSDNPRTVASTWVQSDICDAWTSAGVRARLEVQQDMLFHVIQQHGRQWYRVIPLAVWALREVPSATTGVSPYMLVYWRLPHGPLAMLK